MMQWDLYAIHEGVYYIVVKYIMTHSVESNTTLGQAYILMFLMVFDKVGFCPHIYLSYTLIN